MFKEKNYYSIIDIGSNTIRLVVYLKNKSMRLHEVENVKVVARLRNFLDEEAMLREEGIQKLINTLKSFHEVVQTYNLTKFICVATATVRQARNKQDIQNRVKEEIGWNMKVLSEEEEAYYGYLSVVNSTRLKKRNYG